MKKNLSAATLLIVASLSIASPLYAQWGNIPSLQTSRSENEAVTGPDGKVYVAGGTTGTQAINSVEKLDPLSNTSWTMVAPMSTARARFALVFGTDGYLYAIGGLNGNTSLTSVERYNTATNTWQTMAPMNVSRCQHAAAVGPDGRIYVMGGYTSPTGTSNLNSVEVYNPPSINFPLGQWVGAPSMTTARANHHAVTGLDGKIYVFEGTSGNTWEVFDGATWTSKGALNCSVGPFESVIASNGLMYQLGYDGGIFNGSKAVMTYAATGQTSNVTPNMNQGRASKGAAACAEGRIYVAGGYRKSYGLMNFAELYPVTTAAGLKAPDFAPNCKALWRFDALNGTTLPDSKGTNNGTTIGTPLLSLNNSGRVNKSVNINANSTTQGISVNNSPSINFGTGSMSIEAWIKWTPVSGNTSVVPVIDKRTYSSGKYTGYHVYITAAGRLGFQIANGTSFVNYTASKTTIPAGAWTHIAISLDRSTNNPTLKLYVNSVLDQSFTPLVGNINNTAKLYIGRHLFNNTYFKGEIDELGLFNRSLKWAEIRSIFLAGKEGKL